MDLSAGGGFRGLERCGRSFWVAVGMRIGLNRAVGGDGVLVAVGGVAAAHCSEMCWILVEIRENR